VLTPSNVVDLTTKRSEFQAEADNLSSQLAILAGLEASAVANELSHEELTALKTVAYSELPLASVLQERLSKLDLVLSAIDKVTAKSTAA
jgi:hypothetical protein